MKTINWLRTVVGLVAMVAASYGIRFVEDIDISVAFFLGGVAMFVVFALVFSNDHAVWLVKIEHALKLSWALALLVVVGVLGFIIFNLIYLATQADWGNWLPVLYAGAVAAVVSVVGAIAFAIKNWGK